MPLSPRRVRATRRPNQSSKQYGKDQPGPGRGNKPGAMAPVYHTAATKRTTCFGALCAVMDPFAEQNPCHPLAEEWQEWRPILVQQVPKG